MHNMPLLDKDVIPVNEKLFEMINCYYSQTWKKLGRYTYYKQENERERKNRERNMVRDRGTPLYINVKMMLDGNFILFLNILALSHLQKTPFIICEHNFSIRMSIISPGYKK